MSPSLLDKICLLTGATRSSGTQQIQSLWSGYGEIVKVELVGADIPSVVVKHVNPPTSKRHPVGWNTDRSHERKLQSYEVEMNWYRMWSARCIQGCRVARPYECSASEGGWVFVLEDLDAAGFPRRRSEAKQADIERCIEWLARFHGTFLGAQPTGLWSSGTYWHLATRPDELQVMEREDLRDAASKIDDALSNARFQTIVHGDAKIANFCFPANAGAVAAVDFQYVGGGCGMKDVAYFFSSSLTSSECEEHAEALLNLYFAELREALSSQTDIDFDAVEQEWRMLYPLAWADFYRFLDGWAPGHWKIHDYSARLTAEVLRTL